MHKWVMMLPAAVLLAGCGIDTENENATAESADDHGVALASDWDSRISAEELASGRRDPSWQRVVQLDTAGLEQGAASTEQWEQITAQAVNSAPMQLPLYGEAEGPSALRAQILLDRVLFSPGVIDGNWGKNTEKAVYWFQSREGLRRTGRVDQATFDRLVQLAAAGAELVRIHTLTAEEVEGPFVQVPDDIYEKAELDCLCYESLTEKLGELFHSTPEVLEQLNPGVDLDELTAGARLNVPNVRSNQAQPAAPIAKLVISAQGFYVHAVDVNGRIVYHFPSTLGSSFDPSPSGQHSVTKVTRDPWWHYQPSILAHVPDDEAEARIPPGPNSAVGPVWMALSIPHYGIHGTSAPETIGYTTSAGCVRLTNWDALFLADRIAAGIPVEFTRSPESAGPSEGTEG